QHGTRLAWRQAVIDRLEFRRRAVAHPPRSLAERAAVARHQLLERNRVAAEAFGFGGGAPLAPFLHAVLIEEPMHDSRQICREGAPPLEFADDLVVALDETQ